MEDETVKRKLRIYKVLTIAWWIGLLILGLFSVWVYYNTEKVCMDYFHFNGINCRCGYQVYCVPCNITK
jgi:uncharacterized integral membrane protein